MRSSACRGSEFVSDPDAEGCAFEIFRSAYGVAGIVVFFRDADANQCCLPADGLDAQSQHGSGAKSSDSALAILTSLIKAGLLHEVVIPNWR